MHIHKQQWRIGVIGMVVAIVMIGGAGCAGQIGTDTPSPTTTTSTPGTGQTTTPTTTRPNTTSPQNGNVGPSTTTPPGTASDARTTLTDIANRIGVQPNQIRDASIRQNVTEQGQQYTVTVPGYSLPVGTYTSSTERMIKEYLANGAFAAQSIVQNGVQATQYRKDQVLCVVRSAGTPQTSTMPHIGCWNIEPQVQR